MREIDEIIIHATATNPSWMADKPVDDVVAEPGVGTLKRTQVVRHRNHSIVHEMGQLATVAPWAPRSGRSVENNIKVIGDLVGGRRHC